LIGDQEQITLPMDGLRRWANDWGHRRRRNARGRWARQLSSTKYRAKHDRGKGQKYTNGRPNTRVPQFCRRQLGANFRHCVNSFIRCAASPRLWIPPPSISGSRRQPLKRRTNCRTIRPGIRLGRISRAILAELKSLLAARQIAAVWTVSPSQKHRENRALPIRPRPTLGGRKSPIRA
jgi:hypothetical protein